MQRRWPHGPHLDVESEPWLGTFPGLGQIEVFADGTYTVTPEATPDSTPDPSHERRRALTHGWAEPLSLTRRGFHACLGEALAPLGATGCLLISADAHDGAALLLALHQRGWQVLANRLVPLAWEGPTLIAHPNPAPIVVSTRRAAKLSVEGAPVRSHTDALEVECTRATAPLPVAAMLRVTSHKAGDPDGVQPLTGHRKFEFAASLIAGGALYPDRGEEDPQIRASRVHANHLRLAAIPAAQLHFSGKALDQAVDGILTWWESLA